MQERWQQSVYVMRCMCSDAIAPRRCVVCLSVTAAAPAPAAARTQAAARQTQFEKTPVGRAAYAAVKDAKKPVAATGGQDNAKDWMS